jgi:2-haloacid dehalogenase
MAFAAILFDAYGTLLDVGGVQATTERLFPGQGSAISGLWRDKQLQYSWLRTLAGRYADFWQVTGDALDYAAAAFKLRLGDESRAALMAEYERLAPFADAGPMLEALASRGVPLGVLSNGTPRMLEAAFSAAGLRQYFSVLLSVDAARQFKVAPAAYQLAVDHFAAKPETLLLVSSNGWDIAGAAAFGLRTFWVNRQDAPVERLGVVPDGIGRSLGELPDWLAASA